jgi:ElaB/YqjD/DUF883 family membrane-anchored ribosome-binding protein
MEHSEYATDTAEDVREAAAQKIERAREWSADVLDRVETFVRERPATALLCAVGAGFIVGRLVRR